MILIFYLISAKFFYSPLIFPHSIVRRSGERSADVSYDLTIRAPRRDLGWVTQRAEPTMGKLGR